LGRCCSSAISQMPLVWPKNAIVAQT
jgi:hypothetical protein